MKVNQGESKGLESELDHSFIIGFYALFTIWNPHPCPHCGLDFDQRKSKKMRGEVFLAIILVFMTLTFDI